MPFRSNPFGKTSGALFSSPRKPKQYLIAFTDGGARGNPGPAGFGVYITDQDGNRVVELSEYLGQQTNNYAEYSALVAALEWAIRNNHLAVQVVSDSELMVKQLRGIYKVRNENLQPLYEKAQRLISQLEWFEIKHVLREQNREADRLANEAMDKGSGRSKASAQNSEPANGIYQGVVKNGVIEIVNGKLPEGTRVMIRKA
ncbi:MAG: ribonuclease HI family protein [Terriglobales bacterium]